MTIYREQVTPLHFGVVSGLAALCGILLFTSPAGGLSTLDVVLVFATQAAVMAPWFCWYRRLPEVDSS